jgi:hypothetical protein
MQPQKGVTTGKRCNVDELENVMPSERSQTQKATYYAIPFVGNNQNRQIHKDRKLGQWWPEDGDKTKWRVTISGFGHLWG